MTGIQVAPVHALLSDGTTVRIRQAGPADREEVLRLYQEMSPENLRLRFFSISPASARKAAARLAEGERPGYHALAAESEGRLIGLAEYEVLSPGSTADISVAVADGWHHRGVATLLLEHLADAARTAGVTAFSADALSENHDVLKVFHDLGLRITRHFDGPEVHCTVELSEDDAYLNAVEARGRVADVVSMQPLLRPKAAVVIGAGRKPGSVGRAILRNICTGGYTGLLYAVHPEAGTIAGVHAYRSVADLPQVPDLAVIAVPAAAVAGVAEEFGKAGVRALLVVSAGLDAHQAGDLMGACRRYGMRLVGPNCLGLANTEDHVHLDATFAARHPGPGTAGVAVQSGGVGIALLDGLARLRFGVSSFGDAEKRPAAAHRAIRIREKRVALPVSSCRGRVGRSACRGDPVDDLVIEPCDEDIPRSGDRR